MNYILIALWFNTAGLQVSMTEVTSASSCYEAKAQIEAYGKGMKDRTNLQVMCVKK
mgnify:FL=1|jgi:hypothetical protein